MIAGHYSSLPTLTRNLIEAWLANESQKSTEGFSPLLGYIHESLTVKFIPSYNVAHINLSEEQMTFKLKCIQTLNYV